MRNTASVANWLSDEMDALWSAFPVDAVPRPTVLLDRRVRIEGGFEDVNAKEAWAGGRIGWSTELPPGVSALLPARGPAYTDRELTITELAPATAEFRCDRGPRRAPPPTGSPSPACTGRASFLSPDVDCWWSQAASDEGPHSGGNATIADDQVTVQFPAFGGALRSSTGPSSKNARLRRRPGHHLGARRSQGQLRDNVGIRRIVDGRIAEPLSERAGARGHGRPATVGHFNKRRHIRETARDTQSGVGGLRRGFPAYTQSVVPRRIHLTHRPVDNWLSCGFCRRIEHMIESEFAAKAAQAACAAGRTRRRRFG